MNARINHNQKVEFNVENLNRADYAFINDDNGLTNQFQVSVGDMFIDPKKYLGIPSLEKDESETRCSSASNVSSAFTSSNEEIPCRKPLQPPNMKTEKKRKIVVKAKKYKCFSLMERQEIMNAVKL